MLNLYLRLVNEKKLIIFLYGDFASDGVEARMKIN